MAGAADVPVPWPIVLDALTTMEAQGRVRRGYFVRGLSGIQFALPDVVDRLRRAASDRKRVVAASDPANPYGPILPVPGDGEYRPARVAGSWLVLVGGEPALAGEGRGRRLVPLREERIEAAVAALVEEAGAWPGGRIAVERWADQPVIGSPGEAVLAGAGFSRGPRRMAYRAPVR
jgi:ATP-dependent Lhr-like helicase